MAQQACTGCGKPTYAPDHLCGECFTGVKLEDSDGNVTVDGQALQIAAQCWCDKETESIAMDSRLAMAFAKRLTPLMNQCEQAQVQLAGVSVAALGGTKDVAVQGDYGWSRAYQDTLDLRLKFEEAEKKATR